MRPRGLCGRDRFTSRRWVAVAACSLGLVLSVVPAGVANADCSGAGDFGAGSGCPPPDDTSGSGGGESWPPTSVDWPPAQSSAAGNGGGGSSSGETSTPIVLPDGQPVPVHSIGAKDTASPSAPPTPIVPVGVPSAGPAPTAIVPSN